MKEIAIWILAAAIGFANGVICTCIFLHRNGLMRSAKEYAEWELTQKRKNIRVVKDWRKNPGDNQ